jgi:hypothetical protein
MPEYRISRAVRLESANCTRSAVSSKSSVYCIGRLILAHAQLNHWSNFLPRFARARSPSS